MFVYSLRFVPDIVSRTPRADVRVSAFRAEADTAAWATRVLLFTYLCKTEPENNHINLSVDLQGYIVIRSKLCQAGTSDHSQAETEADISYSSEFCSRRLPYFDSLHQ